MKRLVMLMTLFASNLTFGADVFEGGKIRAFLLGEPLDIRSSVGIHPIWSGGHPWRIFDIARSVASGPDQIKLGSVSVYHTEGTRLISTMTVSGDLELEDKRAAWTDEPCKTDNWLFRHTFGRSLYDETCVRVNYQASYLTTPAGASMNLFMLWKDQGVHIPKTMLQVLIFRQSTTGHWYSFRININPEILGFMPDSGSTQETSDWRKSVVQANPEKALLIAKLGKWASELAKKSDAVFDKKEAPETFVSYPSWRVLVGASED